MGKLVDAFIGKGGTGIAQQGIEEAARRAEQAYFRPYTVRASATGTTAYDPTSGTTAALLNPQYQAALQQALAGAGGLFGQMASFDPTQRAQQVYQEQAALLQPSFEQQATQLQNRLFGSGRLGLRLAGESQGLGAGSGMVQPDALGLGRSQQQTLAQLASQARTQAFGEQAQLGQLASGALQSAMGISGLEQGLLGTGITAEQARAAAGLGAGQLAVTPYATAAQMAQDQASARAGFLGSLMKAGAPFLPGYSGGAAPPSDIRLKENIQHTETLPNGVKLYTWDWKNKELTYPTHGVIAQELLNIVPEAVLIGPDGYFRVNYNHPELKGVH
jgi:hypothetical protein